MNENDRQLGLPQAEYENVMSQPAVMNLLGSEVTISAFDIGGDHVFKTCFGDIRKIVDALRDYSRMLEMFCNTWDLQGYHRALYELHAQDMRKIADKLQAGIGYDYDATLEKCKKRVERKSRSDDPGGEAFAMAYIKSQQTAEAKRRKANEKKAGKSGTETPPPDKEDTALPYVTNVDDPWIEDT